MNVELHGESFASQAAMIHFVESTILSKYEEKQPFVDVDHETLVTFLHAHPDSEAKIAGRELSHFERRRFRFRTVAVFAVFKDGSAIDFSWRKSVRRMFGRM